MVIFYFDNMGFWNAGVFVLFYFIMRCNRSLTTNLKRLSFEEVLLTSDKHEPYINVCLKTKNIFVYCKYSRRESEPLLGLYCFLSTNAEISPSFCPGNYM